MTTKKTKALCVPLNEAETLRKILRERNLLQEDFKIIKDGTGIYFPLKEIPKDLPNYSVVTKFFEVRTRKPRCYKELLKLPHKLVGDLPTSYDIVGSILLVKLPQSLFRYRRQIGEALLQTHRNIRTVCLIDPVSGELRTRTMTILAGENHTLTTHTEYGLTFQVDVAAAYFSPRLASERRRIATLVQPDEIVVDLFAGVAPFSIMIARHARPRRVYAIDKNSVAITLAKKNVKQNHVLETVEVIHADAKDVEKIIPTKADRIIMNLPFSAYNFFSVALSIAASNCKVHYYDIIREEDIDGRISFLKTIAQTQGYRLTEVTIHKIKSYAPREFYIGLDITALKHADVA
ncbi:MAG: class I SAM-dependent methyltransferase family protein [Candidatus Thermoplasmatota archaeon]